MLNKELQLNIIQAAERMRKAKSGIIFGNMSKGEFFTLEMINKHKENNCNSEGICVSDIARGLKISLSATSRMLRQLEEKELITRTVDKTDRRNTYVTLTDLGNERRINVANLLKEYMENIITRMGEQKVTQLIALINEMSDIMEDEFEIKRNTTKREIK